VELASNNGVLFELLAKPVHPARLLKMLKTQANDRSALVISRDQRL
jgi:hypothetical protein